MLELAQKSDLEAINRIALQVHERHVSWRPDIYCHTDCIFPMDYLLECIQEKCLFVAKLEGTVVGFLLFRFWEMKGPGNVPRKVLQLDSIGVEETAQHQGIGRGAQHPGLAGFDLPQGRQPLLFVFMGYAFHIVKYQIPAG